MHTPFCPWQLVLAYLLSTPAVFMPNARGQLLGMAGATKEQTLFPVSCTPLFDQE